MFQTHKPEEAFLRSKFRDYFRCLDRNGNGQLEFHDFELVVEKLGELAPRLAQDVDRLTGAYRTLWDHMLDLIDHDDDGVISEEEFVVFFAKASAVASRDAEVPSWAVRHVQITLKALDLDGDGLVSLSEYANYLRAIGSDAKYELAFTRLDTNGDGRIDLEELSALFGEWLTAGRPGGAGNLLVTGRLPGV